MTVTLDDWRYRHLDRADSRLAHVGRPLYRDQDDNLRLYGKTIGHPTNRDGKYIYASAVVEYNPATRIVKTISGSEYRLGTCAADEAEHMKHLQRDVMRHRKVKPPGPPPVAAIKPKPVAPASGNIPPRNTLNTVINLAPRPTDAKAPTPARSLALQDTKLTTFNPEVDGNTDQNPDANAPVARPLRPDPADGRKVFDAEDVEAAEDL
jgi:hypothetical protein